MSGEGPAWCEIARRGELTLTVLTRARAMLDQLPNAAAAPLFGILHPDDLPAFGPVAFVSIESLQEFVRETKPHSITILVAGNEDAASLEAALQGGRVALSLAFDGDEDPTPPARTLH